MHAQAIGEVNGRAIDRSDYEARIADVIESQRMSTPDPNAKIDESAIREGVWENMIGEILLDQAAERMGIRITDEQFQHVLMYDPPEFLKQQFLDSNGVFQQDIYRSFMTDVEGFLKTQGMKAEDIARIKEQIAKIRKAIRRDLLRQAVDRAVTRSAVPSAAEVLTEYRNQHSRATGSFAMLSADAISDAQVAVSNDEAKSYFEAHRDQFKQTRTIRNGEAPASDTVDVTQQVIAAVRTKKKLDLLKDRAANLRAALSPRDKLSKLASVDKAVRIEQFKDVSPVSAFPGVGIDSLLADAIFTQKLNEISPAIRGVHGYYFVQVRSRKVPTEKEFTSEREEFTRQLTSQRRMAMFQQWYGKERQAAQIKDYRAGGK